MPGHISRHSPHRIAGYTPDPRNLQDATRLNKQFSYQEDELPEQPAIDALFIQQSILTGETILWVIHSPKLDPRQLDLLGKKTASIVKWLSGFGIQMNYIVSDAASISYQYYSFKHYKFHIDKCFFLDNFYAESLLLAGKIPAWWLYINERAADQDPQVIHCGDLSTPRPNDYMSAAIWHLYNVFKQPETSWINLAIIDQFVTSRMHQFFSIELREIVHTQEQISQMDIHQDYCMYLKDTIDIKQADIDYSLLSSLPNDWKAGSPGEHQVQHKTVFDYLTSTELQARQPDRPDLEFRRYHQVIESLLQRSESLFRRIKTFLSLGFGASGNMSHELNAITNGLLSRLVPSDKKIIFTNPSSAYVLDKVHFRQQINTDSGGWSLLAREQDSESEIHQADNLVHLVCWAFVNRLIDTSTQVSIQCADFSIRQIDIQNIIKTLQHNIQSADFTDIDIDNFVETPKPVKSVLFIGHTSDNFREQTIEHLIVYNSGEIFVHSYRGLHVFYNWFESNPQQALQTCLYGSHANDYRSLNQKILSRFSNIAVY
jgi:adenylate cyclase